MLFILRSILIVVWFLPVAIYATFVFALRPRHPSNSAFFTRIFCHVAAKIYGIKLIIRNRKQLRKSQPCVFIANHQHNLDVVFYGSIHPMRTVSIGKRSIAFIPFFGLLYYLGGNLFINRKNHHSAIHTMQRARWMLEKRNTSFLIFPEGTRSYGKSLGKFKKGPFVLAQEAQVKVQPIVASTVRNINLNRWRAGVVIIECLDPIETAGKTRDEIESIMQTSHDHMQTAMSRIDQEAARYYEKIKS